MPEPTVGLLVPIQAKEGSEAELAALLASARPLIQQEANTLAWFAVQLEAPGAYGLFDTFTDDAARTAHIQGEVPKALLGKGSDLMATVPPQMINIDVLATVMGPKDAVVTVGLLVYLKAKADQVEAVDKFLRSAVPLVEAEPETTHWAAVRITGTNTFVIADSFPNEAGRTAHVTGKVAEALFANADALLESPPEIKKTTVLASNIN
ncbi:hypothetical protein SISSUDRAFT_1032387 [Sistotremastrum suecicum HHB10207 ss-3]|uniref:ABM domain-containing protein n=1 Tax=Sistotremastrum suecicum HHB10207 ss-3 TaxID=1314776 RepID=A0A166ENC5_9AGAM|nr:hypothetical protein SISSUDRAFT_1032387 [Sistotremastrum suecicum HHB10207 ss-3]